MSEPEKRKAYIQFLENYFLNGIIDQPEEADLHCEKCGRFLNEPRRRSLARTFLDGLIIGVVLLVLIVFIMMIVFMASSSTI